MFGVGAYVPPKQAGSAYPMSSVKMITTLGGDEWGVPVCSFFVLTV